MEERLDLKRILIFLAFACGIAWATGLIVYLSGGLANSAELIPGTGLTLAVVLVAVIYMGAPALAHVLTRLVTREGWKNVYLRPKLKRGWPYWVIAWFLPAILTLVGMVVFYALFPRYFDPSLSMIRAQLDQAVRMTGQTLPLSPWAIVIMNISVGVLAAPLINSLFTFGEEFGWRAYLQPKLMVLGGRKAMLIIGAIWGLWHWPLTVMGHNYGLDYPGAPWLGIPVMMWMTTMLAIVFGWLTLRGGSVWPAVIGHAAINGIGGIALLFMQGEPNMLLGPAPSGLIGSAGSVLMALILFFSPKALAQPEPEGGVQAAATEDQAAGAR
jgi:membrane protease YdiL (CAAX protease family)